MHSGVDRHRIWARIGSSSRLFHGQALTGDTSMTGTRSLRDLLVWFCRDPETIPPFVHAAYGNGDRVLSAAKIITKFPVPDVAQYGSLVQTRSGGDFGGLQQWLYRD
jgi:hypothetical protein